MSRSSDIDFVSIRRGLSRIPASSSHTAGETIDPRLIVVVTSHRAAIDPDRSLIVGNRGVGKSFWTDVLANPDTRAHVAKKFPELLAVDTIVGFNASARVALVAPTKETVNQAFREVNDAEALWRAVVIRAAKVRGVDLPATWPQDNFVEQVSWVRDHGEQADRIITALDDLYTKQKKKLVLVFDALDQLGSDWKTKREQTTGLLKTALAARSYYSLRLKLFMRRDQFEDPLLFQFADGSKIANQRVDLLWTSSDLYTLLFARLAIDETAASAFSALQRTYSILPDNTSEKSHRILVNAIAGEYMGATAKQGRVYTWLPLHLADARGETSPRTFLKAWREAALFEPAPAKRALDHRGLQEGVRKASGDRLTELTEDYWWIRHALQPLRLQLVPMERSTLKQLWRAKNTASTILTESKSSKQTPPVRLDQASAASTNLEDALIQDLVAIGIIDVRLNEKINVPDIFRLEAEIKRKGGVPAPKHAQRQ